MRVPRWEDTDLKKNNNCKKLSALGDIKAKGVGFE